MVLITSYFFSILIKTWSIGGFIIFWVVLCDVKNSKKGIKIEEERKKLKNHNSENSIVSEMNNTYGIHSWIVYIKLP